MSKFLFVVVPEDVVELQGHRGVYIQQQPCHDGRPLWKHIERDLFIIDWGGEWYIGSHRSGSADFAGKWQHPANARFVAGKKIRVCDEKGMLELLVADRDTKQMQMTFESLLAGIMAVTDSKQSHIDELQKRYEQLRADRDAISADRDALKLEVHETREKCKRLTAEIDGNQSQIDSLQRHAQCLRADLDIAELASSRQLQLFTTALFEKEALSTDLGLVIASAESKDHEVHRLREQLETASIQRHSACCGTLLANYPELHRITAVHKSLQDVDALGKQVAIPHVLRDDVLDDTASMCQWHGLNIDDLEHACQPDPLTKLTQFKDHLEDEMTRDITFSQAIGGQELCKLLDGIVAMFSGRVNVGTDDAIHQHLDDYVRRMFAELTEDANSASILADRFNQEEKLLADKIASCSQELSAPKPRSDRGEREAMRFHDVLALLRKLEEKHDAVSERDSLAAKLAHGLHNFELEQTCAQGRLSIQAASLKKAATQAAAMRDQLLKYKNKRLLELARSRHASKSKQDQARAAIEAALSKLEEASEGLYAAIASDLKSRAELCDNQELLRCLADVVDRNSLHLQELHDKFEQASSLKICACELLKEFAAWMRTAYAGMQAKTEQTLAALLQMHPGDILKHDQLTRLLLASIANRSKDIRVASSQTQERARQSEEELWRLQHAGATQAELDELYEHIGREKERLEWQAAQRTALEEQQRELEGTVKRFQQKLIVAEADADHNSALLPDVAMRQQVVSTWLPAEIFFTLDRPPLDFPNTVAQLPLGYSAFAVLDRPNSADVSDVASDFLIVGEHEDEPSVLLPSSRAVSEFSAKAHSRISAPAVMTAEACFIPGTYVLGHDERKILVSDLTAGMKLYDGFCVAAATPLRPPQGRDIFEVSVAVEGVIFSFKVTGNHRMPARANASVPFYPLKAREICGAELRTTNGIAKVIALKLEPQGLSEVWHVILQPCNLYEPVAYMCAASGDQSLASDRPLGVAVLSCTPLPNSLRVDRRRASVDVISDGDSAAGGPRVLSDPGPTRPEQPRDVHVVTPLQLGDLVEIAREDLPSMGSKDHPNGCGGKCPHGAQCKYNSACRRCHVPGCQKIAQRLGTRQRRKRAVAAQNSVA